MAKLKHAYLLTAHTKFQQVGRLMSLLDHESADIFLHVNKNVQMPNVKTLTKGITHSKVYVVQNRIPIIWGGGYGLLYAELELIRLAQKTGNYDYYHFVTGQDLPIKTFEEFDEFLAKNIYYNESNGKQRTNYIVCHYPRKIYRSRIEQYNFFIPHYRDANALSRYFFKGFNKLARYGQKAIKINRAKKAGFELYYGPSWWSLTSEFAEYVLTQEERLKMLFDEYTFAADEFGIQTVIMNSQFKDSIFHSKGSDRSDNLRLLDFQRGNGLGSPHVYTIEDFEEIKSNNNFFCRKFDADVDSEVIDLVVAELLRK